MTTTGAVAIAARILAPLIADLYKGAKGGVEKNFQKWAAGTFPKRLAKKIASIESVKTLWQFDKEVALRDFYYPASILGDEGPRKIDSLLDFDGKTIVIEGTVGQGKSIFLRYLCVQELTEKGCGRLPIFIELRSVKMNQTIQEKVINELKLYDLAANNDVFEYLAFSGKVAILLDGFDELDTLLIGAIIEELETLACRFDQLLIMVTSRPDCDIQKCARFSVIRLAPLTSNDYLPFLDRLGLPRVRANEISSAIFNSPNEISALITTPLMLTLTVTVYRAENSIPPELSDFFEALFSTVLTRHDKSKPGFVRKHKTDLGERALQKLFETFCFMAAQEGFTRTLTAEQFATTYERSLIYAPGVNCKVESFRYDLCKVACLMLEEGLGDVTFIHKSIAEYFAASFVKRLQESSAVKFYGSALHDLGRWREILKFLAKIDSYRYNSFYLIPAIDNCFEIFKVTDIDLSDGDIKIQVDKIAGDVEIMISIGARKDRVVGYRSVTFDDYSNSEPCQAIYMKMLSSLSDLVPDDLSLLGVQMRHRTGKSTDREVIEIAARSVLDSIGYGNIFNDFRYEIDKIKTIKLAAEKTISSENLKQEIFLL